MRFDQAQSNSPEGHAMREAEDARSDEERENLRLYGQKHSPANSIHYGVRENGKVVTYLIGWQHGFNGNGPVTLNPDCPLHILKLSSYYKGGK
jgi:hypothetical protein